jgi:beta-lactamase class A
MKPILIFLCLLFVFWTDKDSKPATHGSVHTTDSLRQSLQKIISGKRADVGIAIMDLENGDTLSISGNKPYIMMSVVKFPLAMLILREIDRGHFRMDQNVHFARGEIKENTHSPMRDEHQGKKELNLPLSRVIEYAVSVSDNNACDKLLQMLGGPEAVTDSLKSLGSKAIHITYDYAHMRTDSLIGNNSTPLAMLHMLQIFYKGQLLSDSSRKFLLQLMEQSPSGPDRLKGLLPEGTMVAHKTGTYFRNENTGIDAYNDVGLIRLPNGKYFAMVVFVNHSSEKEKATARIIAELARVSWDYFTKM